MREEKDEPTGWPEADMAPEFKQLWEVAGAWRGGPEPEVDAALARLHDRLDASSPTGSKSIGSARRSSRRWLALAAAVAVLAVALVALRVGPLATDGVRTVVSGTTIETVQLPDGSQVLLNKNSSLSWTPNRFDSRERLVELKGEALFTVAPDPERPFRIMTGDAEVRVIGTRFNVRAYPEERASEVAVLSGHVEVAAASHSIDLRAKQCARLEPGAAPRLEAMNVDNAIAWRTGELDFKNTPIDRVLLHLERFFEIEIDWPATGNNGGVPCTVSAQWTDPDIEEVFEALEILTGLQPERLEEDRYRLVGTCRR